MLPCLCLQLHLCAALVVLVCIRAALEKSLERIHWAVLRGLKWQDSSKCQSMCSYSNLLQITAPLTNQRQPLLLRWRCNGARCSTVRGGRGRHALAAQEADVNRKSVRGQRLPLGRGQTGKSVKITPGTSTVPELKSRRYLGVETREERARVLKQVPSSMLFGYYTTPFSWALMPGATHTAQPNQQKASTVLHP